MRSVPQSAAVRSFTPDRGWWLILGLAVSGFALWSWVSYARWADFAYRSFDLAYYVQALWQLIHGRFEVSVQNVPLLGNHVEPIVLLLAPVFALFPHPMLFVLVQNAALASMGPVGYRICRRLGLDGIPALLISAALLLSPATGYIALHEFHPEAFAAPFLLLMLHAWVAKSRAQHWLWFLATLACKENMALLLGAYCTVQWVAERRRLSSASELRGWFIWPLLVAAGWLALCHWFITPHFNAGNIDYAELYSRLGNSAGEILLHAFTQPQLFARAIWHSVTEGNLIWALLLPFLGLPLLRPRWLLVTLPILLQHLLSWRSSEWVIYFHYAAPLLPFFWMATAEALATGPRPLRKLIPAPLVAACLIAQLAIGPAPDVLNTTREWFAGRSERLRKTEFLAAIPAQASVLAPLPYLSHLALRERLYSLHFVIKGLKTLSRTAFEPPPPTDFVLLDYEDTATFDPGAGFYHPAMNTVDGRIIPSSERLLHDFLRRAAWQSQSIDELTLLRRAEPTTPEAADSRAPLWQAGAHTQLTSIELSPDSIQAGEPIRIRTSWNLTGEREVFPWMMLRLQRAGADPLYLNRGLCLPEAGRGAQTETWEIRQTSGWPAGEYEVAVLFFDNSKRLWERAAGRSTETALLGPPRELGSLRVRVLAGK